MPSPTNAPTCEEREALQVAANIAGHLQRLLTATVPLLSEQQTRCYASRQTGRCPAAGALDRR